MALKSRDKPELIHVLCCMIPNSNSLFNEQLNNASSFGLSHFISASVGEVVADLPQCRVTRAYLQTNRPTGNEMFAWISSRDSIEKLSAEINIRRGN